MLIYLKRKIIVIMIIMSNGILENINSDISYINNYQNKSDYLKIIKYPAGMTYETLCMAINQLEKNDNNPNGNAITGNNLNSLYEFKNLTGISSTQTIYKKIDYEYHVFADYYSEFKLCTITNKIFDAITNIRIKFTQIPFISDNDNLFEFVLKIDDSIISTFTHDIKFNSDYEYEFIQFPNIIVNIFKNNKNPKIELFMRQQNLPALNLMFKVSYDAIIFGKSRKELLDNCNSYIFKTKSDLVCMCVNGLYGYKYTTQLLNIIHDKFRPIYTYGVNYINENTNNEYDDAIIETEILSIMI